MMVPYHNSAVIAPMIMKFSTFMKLYVFYTLVTKIMVSLISHNYDVITCNLVDA